MSEANIIIGAGGFFIVEWLKEMMLYTILFSIISLATGAGAVFFVKKKMRLLIRIPAILICITIFFISSLLASITINGLRIGHGAESFISNMIEEPASRQILPFSSDVTDDEKTQMLNILSTLPDDSCQIIPDEVWNKWWRYKLSFENGKTFEITVDSQRFPFHLFGKVDYALYKINEIKQNKGK